MKAKAIKKSPPPPPRALLRFTNKLPRLLSFLFIILTSLVLQTERPTQAAAITVNSTCSLADAITAANTDTATGGCPAGSGADTITLTGNVTLGAALPEISSDITVDGTSSNFSIDGDDSYRIFNVSAGGDLTVNRLSLKNGRADQGPAIYSRDAVNAVINISNSTISNNQVADTGAGFAVTLVNGSLNISNSSFNDNQNGAIFANGSSVTISNSSFSNNRNTGTSGSIHFHKSTSTISNSSFSNNQNGVITAFLGSLTITNSNFSNNQAADVPSAIRSASQSSLTIRHSTFSNNRNSGGRARSAIRVGVNLAISNSIIYGNSPSDCDATLTTNSGNIIGTGTCGTPYSTADPLLGSWVSPADGSPGYFPLQAGSPAIDAVSCITGITTDIRGTSRPQGSNCDIGAYEYDSGSPPPTVDPNITPTTAPTVDPNITPTMTPTVDPSVTPTMTPTVDPNITPTTVPTATDTPDDFVIFSFENFELTYNQLFGPYTYYQGISPEGLARLDATFSSLLSKVSPEALINYTIDTVSFLASQSLCLFIKHASATFAQFLFQNVFHVPQIVMGLKGLTFGTHVGSSGGGAIGVVGGGGVFSVITGPVAAAAGGTTVGGIGTFVVVPLATQLVSEIIGELLFGSRERPDSLEDDVANELGVSPEVAAIVIEEMITIIRDYVTEVGFETFTAEITETITELSLETILTPDGFVVDQFKLHVEEIHTRISGASFSVQIDLTGLSESLVASLFEEVIKGLVNAVSGEDVELDCSLLPTLIKLKESLDSIIRHVTEIVDVVFDEFSDDIRYLVDNIRDRVKRFQRLFEELAKSDKLTPTLLQEFLCAVQGEVIDIPGLCSRFVSESAIRVMCTLPGIELLISIDCNNLPSLIPVKPVINLVSNAYKLSWSPVAGVTNYVLGVQLFSSPGGPWKEIVLPADATSYQLTARELPSTASGYRLRLQTVKDDIASEPVLYPANPNDPTQFAAAPAIIVHENVPAPPADDSDDRDDRDDSVAAAFSTPQAEPRASTCENLPPHLSVQHYHHSTQCNVLSRASVGHPDLVDNFIAGVDIWGYVGAVVEVCIQGSGPLRFVDTSEMPRSVRPLPAFSDGGLTCAWLERVGQVILVPGPPSPPKLKPATPGPATQALSNCMVTLEYILNFRQGPGGPIRKTADGSDFWLPALVSLTALERTADWFYVDYHGERGWISADFVIERGDCQTKAAPALPTALPAWEASPLPAQPAPDLTPVGMR